MRDSARQVGLPPVGQVLSSLAITTIECPACSFTYQAGWELAPQLPTDYLAAAQLRVV